MSAVEIAADYANRMIDREAVGAEEAMRRIEARYGIGYWTLWALRYKRRELKTIAADKFQRIRNAYLATCERQISTFQHALDIEKARSGNDLDADLVDEAAAVVAKIAARKVAAP